MEQVGGCILSARSSSALESSSCAGCMSLVWKAPPALMVRACRAFALTANSQSFVTAGFEPAHVKPEGKRKFATLHSALGDGSDSLACSQSLSTLARSRPATEHMAWGTRSVAACMASPRICTSRRPSSKLSTPAAQTAVYSPRERPATACGRSYTSAFVSFSFSLAARPAMNMMGWQYLVSLSFSSGPFSASSSGSQPRISLAFTSIALTIGSSMTSLSIPTYCEPWPGKSSAAGKGGFFFSAFATLETGRSNGRLRISSGMVANGTSKSPISYQYFRSFFMSLSSLSVTIGSRPGARFLMRRYSCDLMLFFSVNSPFSAWKHHSISWL
mmetsp:Transcript_97661/g.285076  ORF Transcript_97661/g.285076 Transcript_97661/m.285076 type:complete len:330 (-) Transcript_97661:539-1528(-)